MEAGRTGVFVVADNPVSGNWLRYNEQAQIRINLKRDGLTVNGALFNLLRILSSLSLLCLVGCSSGVSPASPSGGGAVRSILSQPANQNVPMGLAGSFAVQASGSNLQYQWSRNGSPISGAAASTYTTPATAFSDNGSVFTVTVSDSAGSVTSDPVSLTVTARAPKPGDLRFQQVDAASTVNGYTTGGGILHDAPCPPPGGGGGWTGSSSATGTGFFLSNVPCSFQFNSFALPAGVTGLDVGYFGGPPQNYQSILDAPASSFGFPGPSDQGSVITSLSTAFSGYAVALGFIHSDTSSGFDRAEYTVPASGLQALATQEGLRGRVLTAISYDGTQASVFSYGWTGDPSTVYETKVVSGTLDTTTDLVKGLAADGYIITATGSSQAEDGNGVILVGTRVQGDTMPRPVLVGDINARTTGPVFAQGYAIVAVVEKFQNNTLVLGNYIGER